jgi:hypothetical protein
MDWFHLSANWDHLRALLNTEISFRVPKHFLNFLGRQATFSLSRKSQPRATVNTHAKFLSFGVTGLTLTHTYSLLFI